VQQVMAMTRGPQLDAETIGAVEREGGFANGGYQKVLQKRQREESERLNVSPNSVASASARRWRPKRRSVSVRRQPSGAVRVCDEFPRAPARGVRGESPPGLTGRPAGDKFQRCRRGP
jgi:hypothetical protein